MNRLKLSEVKEYRQQLLERQGYYCFLCGHSLRGKVANLDHDHKTGLIRSVLCRPCNTLLGKVENFLNTYGHPNPEDFLSGILQYIVYHNKYPTGVYHHTWKTEDEKRLARNAKARKARASKRSK